MKELSHTWFQGPKAYGCVDTIQQGKDRRQALTGGADGGSIPSERLMLSNREPKSQKCQTLGEGDCHLALGEDAGSRPPQV